MSYKTEAPPPDPDGYRRLTVGDPAPWFEQATSTRPRFRLDLAAGRYLLLCFLMGTEDAAGKRALELVAQNRELFNDEKISFFGVTVNWRDQYGGRTGESLPGVRYLWDFDLKVSSLYGVVPANASPGVINVRRCWIILDPNLRIVDVVRFEKNGAERAHVLDVLRNLPSTNLSSGIELPPPVLYLPNAFEPDLCRRLVAAFEADPRAVPAARAARPFDRILGDSGLIAEVDARIQRRIAPEVAKAFQFQATMVGRHVVACYRAESSLSSRREDDSLVRPGLVLVVNLNEDYDGADISFPEFGRQRFNPPLGTAVLFSSSLLYRVSPVGRGQRYVCESTVYARSAEPALAENDGRRVLDDQVTPALLLDDQVTPPPVPANEGIRPQLELTGGFSSRR